MHALREGEKILQYLVLHCFLLYIYWWIAPVLYELFICERKTDSCQFYKGLAALNKFLLFCICQCKDIFMFWEI